MRNQLDQHRAIYAKPDIHVQLHAGLCITIWKRHQLLCKLLSQQPVWQQCCLHSQYRSMHMQLRILLGQLYWDELLTANTEL